MRQVKVSFPQPRSPTVETFAELAFGAPLKDWRFTNTTIDSDGTVHSRIENPAKGICRFDAPGGFVEASYNIDFAFDPQLRQIAQATLTVSSPNTEERLLFDGQEIQKLARGILQRCAEYLPPREKIFRNMPNAIRDVLGLPEQPSAIISISKRLGATFKWIKEYFFRDS